MSDKNDEIFKLSPFSYLQEVSTIAKMLCMQITCEAYPRLSLHHLLLILIPVLKPH